MHVILTSGISIERSFWAPFGFVFVDILSLKGVKRIKITRIKVMVVKR